MSEKNEPAKLLLPYLQRADELQKHEPLVAYYCRLYAMERGLKIPQSERTKTTSSLLISLMNQLEKDKKSLQLGPEDHLHVEGFALNVFSKADKQDRAGRADLNTAKTFYAASIFFEILNQFGELQPDLEQKQKYAAWKAADIRKALKEGRKPVSGPPGGEEEYSSDTSNAPISQRSEDDHGATQNNNSSPEIYDNSQHHSNSPSISESTVLPSPPSYPPAAYSSHDFQAPPPQSHNSENPYNHQAAMPQHHPPPSEGDYQPLYSHHQAAMPQNYDVPSYSYPNFQSYPSFAESRLPAAPSHYPSFYQGSDFAASSEAAVPNDTYSSYHYTLANTSGAYSSEAAPSLDKTYEYDSNYQPPPDKIAEAHKAARFAVGALAFDDVSVAVDYLKKSLELLTNPSAAH